MVKLSIEPEERLPFFCAAAASACATSAALSARAAGDTLFLDSFGTHDLAVMYVGTSVLVGTLAYCFGRYVGRKSLANLLISSCAFLALSGLALRVALIFPWRGSRVLAYFWGDLTVNGSMLLFWSFFGQIFDFRRAKKLMGAVGASGTLTCIATGFLIQPFTKHLGTENLLVLVALFMAGMAASVFYLQYRRGPQEPATEAKRDSYLPGLNQYFRMLKGAQVRALALQAVFSTMVIILVDYQFKVVAQAHFQGAGLASFFGEFYAFTNILVLVIQLFALQYLLRGQTLQASLCLLPAGLLLGGAATILTASFAAVLVTKLVAQTGLFTTSGSAFQILYLGIKKQTRPQARALIDGICKPAAIGITGAALALTGAATRVYLLAIPAMGLCVVWFWLARRSYSLYLSGLIDALSARMLDLSAEGQGLHDKTVEIYTRKALGTAKPEEIPHLLSIVEQMDELDWTKEIQSLLARPEPEVKIAALEYVSRLGRPGKVGEIAGLVSDPLPAVRQAAVRAVRLGGEEVLEPLRESLEDPDPGVRAEAASALIDMGHFGGMVQGVVAVKSMLESENRTDRIAVASPVSRIHARGRTELVLTLMRDPDVDVRLAALRACVNTPEADLVPIVIPQLEKARTSSAAADALIALGTFTTDYLSAIQDPEELVLLCQRYPLLPVILEKIGSAEALQVVRKTLDAAGPHATAATIRAYCQILQRQPSFQSHREHWEGVLRAQLEVARTRKSLLQRSDSLAGGAFLQVVLEEGYSTCLGNILALIGVQAPAVKMDAIGVQLKSGEGEQAARAREVLEHVIPYPWRNQVLELIDARRAGGPPGSLEELLRESMRAENPEEVLLGVLYAAAYDGGPGMVHLLRQCKNHPSEVVQETARFALGKIEKSDEGERELAPLPVGSGASERAETSTALVSAVPSHQGGKGMIVVEKILFLRHVPLFSCLATSELTRVASIAREVTYPAGYRIIQEGDHGDHMFLIVDGEVLIQRGKVPVKTLRARDFFGEMSIIDGEPRSASVIAQTDCLLLRIDKADFEELLATYNFMAISVARALNQRLREVLPALERVQMGM